MVESNKQSTLNAFLMSNKTSKISEKTSRTMARPQSKFFSRNSSSGFDSSRVSKSTLAKSYKTTSTMRTSQTSQTTEQSIKRFAEMAKQKPMISRSRSMNNYKNKTEYIDDPSIVLSSEQQEVYDMVIQQRKSIFFTGSAGTGKSVLLKKIIAGLFNSFNRGELTVAVTASTGLAAVNIGGQTLYRFAGTGIAKGSAEDLAQRVLKNESSKNRWIHCQVLIIDEVSMVDAAFFTKLAKIAQIVRRNELPFGGIQVVVTGDFFQLPPVTGKYDTTVAQYCFNSPIWKSVIEETIMLTKVFRQQGDTELIDMLNTLRLGVCPPDVGKKFAALSREVRYDDGIGPTELYATRNEVQNSNNSRLARLPGEIWKYQAKDEFSSTNPNVIQNHLAMLDNFLCDKELTIKEGAQVMMLKNTDEEIVNGSVGIVLYMLTEEIYYQACMIYTVMDSQEAIKELRLVSRLIGTIGNSQLLQEINKLSEASKQRIKSLLKIAARSKKEDAYPVVLFSIPSKKSKKIHIVEPHPFSLTIKTGKNKPDTATRTQIPLILSWALSIHKSQGQTLDRVKIDLARVFEKGQAYVALSRAMSKERLEVLNFAPSKIRASPEVVNFYKNLKTLN